MKKVIIFIFTSLAFSILNADEIINIFINKQNEKPIKRELKLSPNKDGIITLKLTKDELGKNVKSVAIYPNFTQANEGDDGYFVSSFGEITNFTKRNVSKMSHWKNLMPIHGSKTPQGTYITFVKGMKFAYTYHITKSEKRYLQYISFDFKKNPQYEDIVVDFIRLPRSATYVEMAHWYRNYRIKNDGLKTIKEKIKTRPELAYCINAPVVRIMVGKKPRSKVIEQTPETEPKMTLMNSFENIGKLLEAMKKHGTQTAQICLIGWNSRGHDGRYPQLFPVEESAGGEESLRKLIQKGKDLGYQMTCHTCNTDAYSIADCWDKEYIAKRQDGSLSTHAIYSGGRMYNTCLKRILEIFPEKDFKRMADLGFHGLHYIDVITSIYPYECFDANHRMTPSDGVKYATEIFKIANKYMGGSYSEGGVDFCFDTVDGCIWVYPEVWIDTKSGLIDKRVPFWQLVYNGIVLSTPWNKCQHPTSSDVKTTLKFFEYGGRPRCEFAPALNLYPEHRKNSAIYSYAKKMSDIYSHFKKIAHLQAELMQYHGEIAPNITLSRYESGTEIVCNHSDIETTYKGEKIAPLTYKIFSK